MLQAAHRAGKTVISAAIVERACWRGQSRSFIVPAVDLIDQTIARFTAHGVHAVGAMQGYHPATDGTQPVQVASVQTLRLRKMPEADLVIIDEAHRWFDSYIRWMAGEWESIPVIGLSATPWPLASASTTPTSSSPRRCRN